jgi:predicted nucleic acid-binding protein
VAVVGPQFFDTSVLLAGIIDFGESARPAQRVFDAIADGRIASPHTAWHCCLEFYAVSTRLPEEFRLSPDDCWRLMEEELIARFRIHQLPGKTGKNFFRAAASEGIVGGRIYDAHIAEIAHQAGSKVVVTDNRRHFTSLLSHGIRVLTAEEFARALRQ